MGSRLEYLHGFTKAMDLDAAETITTQAQIDHMCRRIK